MILWLGFNCNRCGIPVTEQTADLYIKPDGIIAIHKNATICGENGSRTQR